MTSKTSKIKIPTSFEEWTKLKAKQPQYYTFDDNGDAVVVDKNGDILSTIEIPYYRAATFEELDAMDNERREMVSAAEDAMEIAQEKLRERLMKYRDGKRSAAAVMRANIEVEEADIARQTAKYPVEFIYSITSIDKNRVLFDAKYDVRKLEHPLVMRVGYPYDLTAYYTREGEAPPTPSIESSVEESPMIIDGEIYFDDPEDVTYGFLSPYWSADIVVGTTEYCMVGQAVAAEIATRMGEEEYRKKILDTRSPKTIRKLRRELQREKGLPEMNILREIHMAANRAKFTQHKDLLERLLATENAPLMYANSSKTDGLGRTYEEIKAGSRPTGTNLVGEVLQDLRTELRGSTQEIDEIVAASRADAAANRKDGTISAEKVASRRLFFIRRNSGTAAATQ
jgi:ribA/ribD-fused uncharacterized protein